MSPVMTPFFSTMAQLFEILSTLPRRDFAAGETIIAEDSTTGRLFFLINGEVEVTRTRCHWHRLRNLALYLLRCPHCWEQAIAPV